MSDTQVTRKKILLVDDNQTNLTAGKDILKGAYSVYPAPSARVMFTLLENLVPDMILLDIEMPEMDGYQAIKLLKADPRWKEIPVIFLTSKNDEGSELEGLSLGAVDYVGKPFSAPLLLKRIENHLVTESQKQQLKDFNEHLEEMVDQRTRQVMNLQNTVLRTVAELVEFRDNVTGGHIVRTQGYLRALLDQMIADGVYSDQTSRWDRDALILSAPLHDVGKIAISDAILNKPGPLTKEEFGVMKTHAAIGEEAIRRIEENVGDDGASFLRQARLMAGSHHEKWDGTGYPRGLKGENIPLEGRMMAIADVYDALISRRPYKDPMSGDGAREMIERGKGIQFDPALVDEFEKVADKFAAIADGATALQL